MAAAAYDYYPFGMLMPERYVEDGSTQCIPVTYTRYVTKEEDVRNVLAADEGLTLYAASPGVRLRFIQGLTLSFNITYKPGYYFRKPALNYGSLDETTTIYVSVQYPA